MSKIIQLASQYLTDKDLRDLFAGKEIPKTKLLKIGNRRGILMSSNDDIEDVQNYLCSQIFSFSTVERISSELNIADNISKEKTRQVLGELDAEKIKDAIEETFKARTSFKENYKITPISGKDNSYNVEVSFVELNLKSATPLQRIQRVFTIELENTPGSLDIRFSGIERAGEVVRQLVRALPYKDKDKSTQRIISLHDVRDSAARIAFFFDIIQNVEGFTLLDVKEIHMEHRLPDEEEDDEEEGGEETKEESAESEAIKGLLRKAALNGKAVHTTDFYDQLKDSGYYIGSIVWTAQEIGGDHRIAEFACSFDDPVYANEFNFAVRRVIKPNVDKGKKKPKGVPPDMAKIKRALEKAAYSAYAKVEESLENSNTGSDSQPEEEKK
ncbi:MAG: hypothetical protein IAE94_05335 [Chthoniobacterales bacterium]|nr:hypothetical protein [Chthoniobacterales bacterium]